MSRTYEISKFESNMPIRCYIHHIGHVQNHSHEMFEILFILSGECNLIMDNHLYQLKADDIFIIEDFLPHELHSSDCVYATIQLDRTRLENTFPSPIHPSFECNSQIPGKEQAYDALRRQIAYIIKNNADKPLGYEIKNWIYVYELMENLFINFRVEKSAAYEKKNHRYAERVHEISKIIKSHYTEDLTLSALADQLHLSVPYLSKFFMDHFGVNYLTYLTRLRVKNAEYELLHTEKTIETIAADCGFPNSNAFTSAFKKEYGTLPSSYRRSAKSQPTITAPIEYHDYMAALRKYLTVETEAVSTSPSLYEDGSFSSLHQGFSLSHSWRNIIAVGQASDLLLGDVQKMLSKAQNEICFQYIFMNGIFSDTLYLYHLNIKDEPTYNFAYIDRILDFVLGLHLKPMLPLSYMPKDLAQNPDRFLFGHLVSEPKSLDLWCDLVYAFLNHLCTRYGLEEITSWRFSVWHEPNTPSRLFGFEKKEDFFTFYSKTREIVKSFSPNIPFGNPCMYYLRNEDAIYEEEMLQWCKRNDCLPDFLNYSFYDTHLDYSRNKSRDSFGFVDSMALNSESDGLKQAISQIKKLQRKHGLDALPVYISEWNNTPSQQDYLNDTCFKSCYIVKNIIDNYDRINGLSYWALTDLMAEQTIPDSLFFGGLGLFTTTGIPKASYIAMTILRQMGDTFLSKGDCWYATKTDRDIRIIAYNYRHYTQLYAEGERFDMTHTDRYTMFEPSTDLNLHLTITDLEPGKHLIREYILNRENGSAFDTWVDSGCLDPACEADNQYLTAKSIPKQQKSSQAIGDNTLSINVSLKTLEVRLIVISL